MGRRRQRGEVGILWQRASTIVEFDPRFEIMPGTKADTIVATEDPYAADARRPIAGWQVS